MVFYSKFGKQAKDLLSKKFDYDNKLTHKHSTPNGLTIESTLQEGSGKVEGTYKHKCIGKYSLELGQSGSVKFAGENSKFVKGLTMKTEGGYYKNSTQGKVDLEYSHDLAAATLSLDKVHTKAPVTTATVATSYEGLSVGGTTKVAADLSIKDYNVAVQYSGAGVSLACLTANKLSDVTVSYFNKVNADYTVGAMYKYKGAVAAGSDDEKDKPASISLAFGNQYQLDKDTLLKTAVDTSGVVNTALIHTMANPSLKLNIASSFNYSSTGGFASFTPGKFGVGVSLGDL
jgi:hypothetical protein